MPFLDRVTDAGANPGRSRLDEHLVRLGHYATRSRARDAIERGTVRVDGTILRKPGAAVAPSIPLEIDDPAQPYVSRAALKLIAGLDRFGVDPAGRMSLDLGASTGGFTQVLLERGASHVVAVDVGHGQMDAALRRDPRVTCLEGLNARDLTAPHLGGRVPQLLVSDVSFISLRLALPPALALCCEGAMAVFLVKPQFEAGRQAIGKGGLLRDAASAEPIAESLVQWLGDQPGWRPLGLLASPIDGSDGNREFLLGGIKDR